MYFFLTRFQARSSVSTNTMFGRAAAPRVRARFALAFEDGAARGSAASPHNATTARTATPRRAVSTAPFRANSTGRGLRTRHLRASCSSRPRPGRQDAVVRGSSVPMADFLVRRDDMRTCRIADSDPPSIESGQALLRVDTFGLTANNVTYAVFGEAMSYWDFFPAEEGWGRVPMWGFAEVAQSEAEGVEPGARFYGYLPPSSSLLVTPRDVAEHGFVDGSPHRAELPAAYQSYSATGADPFYRADTEEIQMLLRPLFFTSFLIDDQLSDDGLTERGRVVISSASSKTAIGAGFLLAQREGVELVGLTSPRSAEFVEGLGIYGRTVTYDALDSLEREPATFVDIAGDAE